MKHVLTLLLTLLLIPNAQAEEYCAKTPKLFKHACIRLHQTWYEGKNELYIPAYAWHNRYYYSGDRIHRYNENPWGGGLGKSFYDEDGDWHALYAFAFLDSHKNVEPIVGYAFEKMLHFNEKAAVGAGYAILVTSRPDIMHSIPFPGVLPWVSANYQRASVALIYIPGGHNIGNVLFVLAKWVMD
ncbi:MAG: lipid IV(A) palmitoyltransferase PagP [Gammaproteobacteria bacterium]|nr:lipid IV(A) palmitoyltransferase PagP [Gammaproteobacteria bacterium]